MNCKEIEHLIADYEQDKIDHLSKRLLDEHLEGCQSCKQVHQEYVHLIYTINQVNEVLPDKDLALNFYDMLDNEKSAAKASNKISKPKNNVFKPLLQVAATMLLMISCYLLGSYKDNGAMTKDLAALIQEKTEMQAITAMSLMENESASKRLQAVSYAKAFSEPDNEILSALISKMRHDKHTNVRLAAANALAKFSDNSVVRQALIIALETEENANMQIELIQILVDIEEEQAIPTMKKILQNDETPIYIKDQINAELQLII